MSIDLFIHVSWTVNINIGIIHNYGNNNIVQDTEVVEDVNLNDVF